MTNSMRFLVPLGLAVAAALANFALLKRQIPKVEVLVVTEDIAEGQPITREQLGTITIGADEKLFPSALRAENSGEVEGLAARRGLRAGEMLFRADVVETLLSTNSNEHEWRLVARAGLGVRLIPGDQIHVVLAPPNGKVQHCGPYRLLGWFWAENTGKERMKTYVLAVPNGDKQEFEAQRVIAANRNNPDVVQGIGRKTSDGKSVTSTSTASR